MSCKTNIGHDISNHDLQQINNTKIGYWNLTTEELVEKAIINQEGTLCKGGALMVDTGSCRGRSPQDKFIVKDALTNKKVNWDKVNQPMEPALADRLYEKCINYMNDKDLYITDVWAGSEEKYRLAVRCVNTMAYHNFFAQNMFIIPTSEERKKFKPDFTVLHCPTLLADPANDGTNSKTFIVVNMAKKYLLIGGTEYSGEMKKGIFGVLNFLLPEQDVLPMHCSANMNEKNETAVFFGLSGTGKTTLSADPNRILIGDDEHGWDNNGVFNFEGGCYAKIINLNPETEPMIFKTTQTFGSIVENVVVNEKREIDLFNSSKTKNTRSSYPLTQLANVSKENKGGHPKNIIMLTCDAFGVLPAVSKLTKEQAMYHFLSGYTAKVSGTEKGVHTPEATFSTCFGEPFMPRNPFEYAKLLGEKMAKHKVTCWLVNTGWQGGAYGEGKRISLPFTRAIISSILDGSLSKMKFTTNVFNLATPVTCNNVPKEVLNPCESWESKTKYQQQVLKLQRLFQDNFVKYQEFVDFPLQDVL
ncbi:Phosphoenolpyruvate carboxykinase (ATP) [Candidatus Hepatincola sp. Av]